MAESADARDSKSRGINFPCGFKSHLRYLLQKDLRKIDVSPFFVRKIVLISILAQECESGFVVENSVLVVELKIDQILSRG